MGRVTDEQSRVTFTVRHETEFGHRLRIVGDVAALGGWDPLRGQELTTSSADFPKWTITLTLPAKHKINYKYVRMSPAVDETLQQTARQQEASQSQSNEDGKDNSNQGPDLKDASDPSNSSHPSDPSDQSDSSQIYWEPFDDTRIVETASRATIVVDDGDFSKLNNTDPARVRTLSRVLSSRQSRDSDADSDTRPFGGSSGSLLGPFSSFNSGECLIIAIYRLPIIAERDEATKKWTFAWDDDALYLTCTGLRRGLEGLKIKPLWIGILNREVPADERDSVSTSLREKFNCVPIFIQPDTLTKFYQGFCKGVLWKPFHMLTNTRNSDGTTLKFDDEAWHAYQRVNRQFSSTIVEHYERHLIWVHDYHLMMLPYYLRVRLSGVRIGFYLHIPWPSSEIFRMLPVRNEILKALLSATMLGFHLFDYARHFLSACVRLLNLEHEAKRGSLGIEYLGRHVMIRVSHIGVDPERFADRLGMLRVRQMASEYEVKYPSKTVFAAVDDLDYIKGIALKLIAFEHYLEMASERARKQVALIQVALPKAARVDASVRSEIRELVDRINSNFGSDDHQPVLYIEKPISFDERVAIYSVCDALFLTPIRDGLNLIPYEYIVSTPQGKGQLILSEFTGCSRALSSAVRVNPWDVELVRDVIDNVVQKREKRAAEIRLKHEADRKYVTEHSSATWANSFLRDLHVASENVQEVVRLGLSRAGGFGRLEFVAFTMLNSRDVLKAFRESKKRLLLFDYDGTLTQIDSSTSHMAHTWARPNEELRNHLEHLSKHESCSVVILSGRGIETEGFYLEEMKSLGIAAEHGFYYKRPGSTKWIDLAPDADLSWLEVAHPIMQLYTDRTDGSYIEEKSAGLVWHYLAADPEFGQWQAKEMHDHLEGLLTPYNVQVVSGHGWLQVRLDSVNKGNMVSKILEEMDEAPDFILCCGDDRTDEDMFKMLEEQEKNRKKMAAVAAANKRKAQHQSGKHSFDVEEKVGECKEMKLFTATVGVKPSHARYYVRSSAEIAALIEGMVDVTNISDNSQHVRSSTLEDMRTQSRLASRRVGGLGGGASGGDGGEGPVRGALSGLARVTLGLGASASSNALSSMAQITEGADENGELNSNRP